MEVLIRIIEATDKWTFERKQKPMAKCFISEWFSNWHVKGTVDTMFCLRMLATYTETYFWV
jgi:hypothetical protein